LTREDKLYINNGTLSFTDKDELPAFDLDTVRNMQAAGLGHTQLVTVEEKDVKSAEKRGMGFGIDPFRCRERGQGCVGVLDTTGGVVVADKACRFALHKARALGVRFVFDEQAGAFEAFWRDDKGAVVGVLTQDGKKHRAEKVVMACGGYTPMLVPQLDGLCETTAGSQIMLRIPRESPLFDRFAPERFPSYMWKLWDGVEGGLYGFPRDDKGWLKIGYRGIKYTNPQIQPDGKVRSVPITRYTPKAVIQIPQQAMKVFKRFLTEYLPEFAQNGIDIALTRLCWYTDSFDNHYVVDDVPGLETVLVATGGSGHAFKYLPNIGKWIVDILEGKGLERTLVQRWRWRALQPDEKPFNVLMEGLGSPRAFENVAWSRDSDLNLGSRSRL
jgi:sarcosine oxidase / L-pipecolate oxidase